MAQLLRSERFGAGRLVILEAMLEIRDKVFLLETDSMVRKQRKL